MRPSQHVHMDLNELRAEAKRLQSAEPSKAIRGFDEKETRTLLNGAACLLETAAQEREELQRELEKLRAKVGEEGASKEAIGKALLAATRASEEMAAEAHAFAERIKAEAEARATAILDEATRSSAERERETVAARARLEAEIAALRSSMEQEHAATRAELERERERLKQGQESLRGSLERERDKALEEARVQAEKIVADARHEVRQLEDYAERVRSLLADSRRNFIELVEAALQRVESIDSQASGSGSGELLDDLRPAEVGEKTAPSGIAGD